VTPVRYVALLRGINVGGKTLVKMAELKTCFEHLGFDGVSTYIASGNVLFETDGDGDGELATTIEAALQRHVELPLKVVVLDQDAYTRIIEAIPTSWIGNDAVRANVAFVRPGTDASEVVRELEPDAAIEEMMAVDRAVLWATRRDSINRSVVRKLIGSPAYKELTIRNLNTALKLHDLLAG
jgi:uncharacterized protein (DUF1697 family)